MERRAKRRPQNLNKKRHAKTKGRKRSPRAGTEKRSKLKKFSVNSQAARVRGLNAINWVRQGKSNTLPSAARLAGTSVRTIQRLLPAAINQNGPGGRIRVRARDPYSARVEIITDVGPLDVNARGSRERELAGRHRAAVKRVLRGDEPPSTLKQFRGKKVGGQELASNFDRISEVAQGGGLDQLDSLYVSPETRV